MKQQLRQIYDDLSTGRLSQSEALERIKAIKLQEQGKPADVLLVTPIWQASGAAAAASTSPIEYAEHHVVLCELSTVGAGELRSLLPDVQCLSLQAAPWQSIAERYTDHALAAFERIQAILRARAQGKVLVQIVVGDDPEQAVFAAVSGLLRTAALENPQLVGQLILVPADIRAEELGRRLEEEKRGAPDPQIRYEQGVRQIFRWQELAADPHKPPIAFKDPGVYLITGGLGGLGLLFAGEILGRTREARIVLTGRSTWSAEKQSLLDGVSSQAERVSYRQVDLGDVEQVRQLIVSVKEEYGQLDGILHSAGMVADNFILKKSLAEFGEVLAPKVTGTFNLDQASRDVELDFFVLFSSVVGAMGNVAQADYAAANGFMDRFAAYRNRQVVAGQRHGRTRSINWPLWEAGGMGADPAGRELLRQATGIQPMQTTIGMDAFHQSLAWPYHQLLVAEGDLTQMRRALHAGRPIQPELSPASEIPAAEIDPDILVEKTENYLRRQCSELLKVPSHKIDPQAALEKYGIDSILAMKLTSQLEKAFDSLPKTLFFEYQTIRDLATYFIRSHPGRLATLFAMPDRGDRQATTAAPTETLSPAHTKRISSRRRSRPRTAAVNAQIDADPIAIVGLSGRYPEAADINAYWQNLREGKDCIVEVPKERWDWREYFNDDRSKAGHHYSKWGGFIAGVDEFDPLFFNISPREAKHIDPQERLFLQHAWMAIEDAGYTRASLQVPDAQDLPGQAGVYVGVMYSEYQLFGVESSMRGKRLGIAGGVASIANRVSYALNIHGPSMAFDTMCSSSLTAIHVACQDLKLGRTSLAIAGGVNVSIHPNKYLMLSAGQFISSDGHCQSFGEGGDGYIPGEGVGAVILKRLSDAQRDGDHIYGIIRGSALNHGGKTNGYTVPNPQAQATAIRRALAESETDSRHVSYIEAHGTGTRLGDPIEIAALSKAFQQDTQDTEFCRIGSVKSNIGHCESAAGIAGLTKVLLQMQHQQLVPSLHSEQVNPHIDFARSPFVLNHTLRPWEQPVIDGRTLPRIAGVSSFGAGGSNAHMIVAEYEPPVLQPVAFEQVVVLLSARTAEQLRQKARDLLELVRARLGTLDLVAVAYTLQVGREAMDERLGFVVSSVAQLAEKLQAYVAGEQAIEDAYEGQVKRNKDALSVFSTDVDLQRTVDKWIAGSKLAKLVDLWVKGLELDWSKLYGDARPRRLSLPAYPFARERYWVDTTANDHVPAKGAAALLHPLLHSNTSDLTQQSYSSTFSGEEFFLKDHQMNGQRMLPAATHLEMARVAVQKATPASRETLLELRDVVWAQPIVVDERKTINIALLTQGDDEIGFEIYSQDAEQEIVHCQGRAVLRLQAPPVAIDLPQLEQQMGKGQVEPDSLYAACARTGLVYGPALQCITAIHRGNDQLLARLRLPMSVAADSGDYVLHPSVIDGALQTCIALIDSSPDVANPPQSLFALESLRILSPCTPETVAWVRYAPRSRPQDGIVEVDIDVCDARGNIAVQMRGVSWRATSLTLVEPVLAREASPAAAAVLEDTRGAAPLRKEIVFIPSTQPTPVRAQRKKPATIALAEPNTVVTAPRSSGSTVRASAGWAPVALSNATLGTPMPGSAAPAASSVRLYDDGNGIFSIQITRPVSSDTPVKNVVTHLLQALERVQQEASAKVLLLSGIERGFARGGREEYNQAIEQGLLQTIISLPYPVIGLLEGDAIGTGFLVAALCDFIICNEDANYGYTDPHNRFYPTTSETILFSERFGHVQAQDFLYRATTSTGRQLQTKGWTCAILPADQIESHAQTLASTLATRSRDALRLLKQHLTRHLVGPVKELARVEFAATEDPFERVTLVSPGEHIHLEAPVEHVLVIRLGARKVALKDLTADLGDIFTRIHRTPHYKAVVLVSEDPALFSRTDGVAAEDAVLQVQRLLVGAEIPVVAALEGNAKGNAWLVAQFCDTSVYSRQGSYSAAHTSLRLAQTAAAVFAHRFGNDAATEILFTGADYSGDELQERVGSLIVAEHDHVLSAAVQVAAAWARLPRATLLSWKQHTAAILQQNLRSLHAEWEETDETSALLPVVSRSIALHSETVTATAHPNGIVVVKMEDRHAKNMFSEAFIEGITEAFAHIEQTPSYKVVVLTGYDSYFASGGTKESLLAIQEGKARFTDFKIFQLPLDCKLPVIAAMQGHGIGAGWTLGMFADVVLLSEESRYVSPYMSYGFTPGAGATWVLPEKIGHDLARESLLTAQPYAGRELKNRGLTLRVLPRTDVYPAATALATRIAQVPRGRLISFKQQLTARVREALEETYRLELAMHDETFVGRPDTLALIHQSFHQEVEAPVSAQPARVEPVPSPIDHDVLPAVTASLKTLLANELQMRESDIDENVQFVDLGLDSIAGVTWVRKINEKYHTSIEATRVYSYPTLSQLSRYVKDEAEKNGTLSRPDAVAPADSPASGESAWSPNKVATTLAAEKLTSWRIRTSSRFTSAPAPRPSTAIAVIGMAGQFPEARNLEEFWQNIAQGRNCITQVPSRRWDVNTYYRAGNPVAGKTNCQWAGALEEYDLFDPLFFNISPTEAECMDPQQRLFLQACWHSIENAGYDARVLSGSRCGVFVGCAAGDYHQLSREHQLSAQGFTGSATSILAARISYFLNLQGPCISIDTACSSSLVAIAQACDSLIANDSDLALAGGVYVMSGPEMHIKTAQAGMLSPEGHCFTFDQRADGFVLGEGVGVVLLKRLADAQRDQDIIHGVIHGWGVNQDGKTNGITAPNPESQTRLEQEVYDKYEINPASIQLVEAHGTGTKLGDPIEVEGLKAAFRKYTQNKEYCALGSVKSNIGHCLTAAGIGGVIKVLLALQHKQLPPTINFEKLNEHIDLKGSPFYVNSQLQEWKLDGAEKRHAAISSFGFSGTNAHVVIGEHLPTTDTQRPVTVAMQSGKTIVPLSARTPAQLQQKVRDLLAFIRRQVPSSNLIEMSYTLQAGREAMEERLGFLVSSVEQLTERLEAYVHGDPQITDVYRGEVKRGRANLSILSQDEDLKRTVVDKWIAEKKLSKLLELWVSGLELDWSTLYGEVKPQRICLPAYPFAKERYWIDAAASGQDAAGTLSSVRPIAAVLHPLLHRNTSDLSEQRFSTAFSGDEFFLADHVIKGAKVLPGVCHLEMARAAVMASASDRGVANHVLMRFKDVVWTAPLIVGEPQRVHVGVHTDAQGDLAYEIYSDVGLDVAGEDSEIVHGQGRAVFAVGDAAPLDWPTLKAGCDGSVDRARCYAALTASGIAYGPAHRGIRSLDVGRNTAGERYVLAEVELPECVSETRDQYVLHPSVVDSALQASLALTLAESGSEERSPAGREARKPRLPFALDEIEIFDRSPAHAYVYIRERTAPLGADEPGRGKVQKLDIDISDESGRVCVRLRGLTTRELDRELDVATRSSAPAWKDESLISTVHLAPRWDAVMPPPGIPWPSEESRILLVGGTAEQQQAVRARYRNVRLLELSAQGSNGHGDERILTDAAIDHVLWLTPPSEATSAADERLLGEQSHGVLRGLRLIKALLRLGYETKDLGWTVVTWQTQATEPDERILPSHASVHGLIGSLAKEYSRWKIRLVDLPSAGDWPLDEILRLPADAQGDAWVYRAGEWYRQYVLPCELPASPATTYRRGGVYVVIGGAGGIGEAFSEYLIRNYRAQVIWIGRRALDADIQAKLDRLSSLGPAPTYLCADARDRHALARAYDRIAAEHGQIHGLVHAAIALFDQSLAQIDEDRFKESLSAKADVSVRIAQVFAREPMDFVVFFSSLASFAKPAGQSNYSAGCTFKDAFAHQLAQEWSCPVKVVNWGYWGSRGIVASSAYRARMEQNGVGSIEPEEGMVTLEQLLATPIRRLGFFKGQPHALAGMAVSQDRIAIATTQQVFTLVDQLSGDISHVGVAAN